jgi:hypothetical protein
LHKVPHYCFGTVAGSIKSLLLFVFFPNLRPNAPGKQTNYLTKQDEQAWVDTVLVPAMGRTINDSALASYLPVSEDMASRGATAVSAETLKQKESAREQLLEYRIQHQYLDSLWVAILEIIAGNPGLSRFKDPVLFTHAKNTKLAWMSDSILSAYQKWSEAWDETADPEFYSRHKTHIDLAKTITSENFAYPHEVVPDSFKAETYLWRTCCLESYARTRVSIAPNKRRARGSPIVARFPWATMRDTAGYTLSTMPGRLENLDGLAYSQFYANIKTPFDVSKVYVFDNEALDNLALDASYVQSLQQQGGGSTFSTAALQKSYLHSKGRASASLRDNQRRSYGIREEHRVTLTLMDKMCQYWEEWESAGESTGSQDACLPYYIIPSQEVFQFLSAQINKYCFLFERTLAHTAKSYSLPETMVMSLALRALRFSYGGGLLPRELLLYKDRWERTHQNSTTVHEGVGMQDTMLRTGLGWFLPKFNWATCRIAQPHGDNMLVGNLLMHSEYKRRWKAVKDLRDVFIRLNQAMGWFSRHHIKQNPPLLALWLEYMHALVIEQFDADIWLSLLAADKRRPELSPQARQREGSVQFCMKHMKDIFLQDGVPSPPHIATGNRMRFQTVGNVLEFLFLESSNGLKHKGWGSKPFRLVFQKTFDLLKAELGHKAASTWLNELFYLIRLTHWILPYPSESALIESSKTSAARGLKGRTMWLSCVFAGSQGASSAGPNPDRIPKIPAKTVFHAVYHAHRRCNRPGEVDEPWNSQELIKACREQGLLMIGADDTLENWAFGRASNGCQGYVSIWERGVPPRLAMQERIQGLGLDELDSLIIELIQQAGQAPGSQAGPEDLPASAAVGAAAVASNSVGTGLAAGRSASGSLYVPSL